jgi:hypothetical protein
MARKYWEVRNSLIRVPVPFFGLSNSQFHDLLSHGRYERIVIELLSRQQRALVPELYQELKRILDVAKVIKFDPIIVSYGSVPEAHHMELYTYFSRRHIPSTPMTFEQIPPPSLEP